MSFKGIDVSEHQDNINWVEVKNSGIDFAILRLGWIGNKNNHTLDKKFERNYEQCKKLQIPIGVYIYCYSNSVKTIKEGANWTVEKLKNKNLELPVYIDMEDDSIISVGKSELTNMCIEFNKIIEGTERWAGVYANKNWLDNYLNVDLLKSKYTIWIAHFGVSENKYENIYDMLQYTDSGNVGGIIGKTDLNVLYKNIFSGDFNNEIVADDNSVKYYQNGSTREDVFSDTNLSKKIGSLNPGERAIYLGSDNDRPLVKYKVDGTNVYKCGYVKWKGGIED